MKSPMAESPRNVEQRLEKLETDAGDLKGAVVQITTILVEQGQRVDAGFRQVWEETRALRQEMRGLNQRIMETEDHLKYAQIITPEKSGIIQLGSTVTIEQSGKHQTFTILGPTETNPAKGIISHKSPLGEALMGKRVGDAVRFRSVDKETELTVVRIA